MLQRIQTVFFTVALILVLLPIFGISLFSLILNKSEITVDAFNVQGTSFSQNHFFWIILLPIILTLLLTIFSFKKRKTQLKLAWLSLILIFILTAWMLVAVFFNPYFADAEKSIGLGFISLILSLPCIYFGIRGVKKDQALIDSLNRLR
jgi:hypothetical protein